MPKVPSRKPKTIGIIGSRRRDLADDFDKCRAAFFEVYEPGDCIVSGGCKDGGDHFAEIIAREYGFTITIHYPRKEQLDRELLKVNPRAAYAKINYARNTLIAEDSDVLIALVAPDRKGGTEDTVKKYLKLGKDRIIYA